MTVVKQLVKSGITICATIHSPTPYGTDFNSLNAQNTLLLSRDLNLAPARTCPRHDEHQTIPNSLLCKAHTALHLSSEAGGREPCDKVFEILTSHGHGH